LSSIEAASSSRLANRGECIEAEAVLHHLRDLSLELGVSRLRVLEQHIAAGTTVATFSNPSASSAALSSAIFSLLPPTLIEPSKAT
jgi:hypothetical protein